MKRPALDQAPRITGRRTHVEAAIDDHLKTQAQLPLRRHAGTVSISGQFTPEWRASIRMVQAITDQSVHEILAEALSDVFRRHNVPVPADSRSPSRVAGDQCVAG